ncbi:MAG: VanZ family protein [Streptococcus salivarius]|nr:VanZ family protein [Streptococcus salivarius]
MFQLKTWVDKDGELTPKGRKLSRVLVCAYLLCLVLLCWTPQYGLVEGVETPGIQHFGRVVVLLTPFTLILGLLALYPRFRSWKKVLLATFAMSLAIEVGQVILDLLIDANRVFELDDLWTNTLGGLVALGAYRLLVKLIQTHFKE